MCFHLRVLLSIHVLVLALPPQKKQREIAAVRFRVPLGFTNTECQKFKSQNIADEVQCCLSQEGWEAAGNLDGGMLLSFSFQITGSQDFVLFSQCLRQLGGLSSRSEHCSPQTREKQEEKGTSRCESSLQLISSSHLLSEHTLHYFYKIQK